MTFKRAGKTAMILLFAIASGCTANHVSTHASAFDHSDINRISAIHGHDENERGGSYRSPAWQHTSLRGDKSRQWVASGQQNFKQQNYGLAHEAFQKAVETRSDSANAWLGLAASLDQLGKFREADRAYEQLVRLKGDNARILNNIGYSYLLRGDYQKARSYLNRAQTIDPSLEEIQGNIHLLEKTIDG